MTAEQYYPVQDQQTIYPPEPEPGEKGTSGLAVTGLVLGIVAIATSFMPIINNVSFFIAIVGLILAIVGLVGINKGKKKGKGMAIAGLVLNVIAFVVVLASQAFYSSVLDSAADSLRAKPAASSQEASNEATQSASAAAGSNIATDSAFTVSIDGAELVQTKYSGQCIVVTYTFTNNSTDDTSFMLATTTKAFQNGVELENAYSIGDWDSDGASKTIKTGASVVVKEGYKVTDMSPVTVEVGELWDFSDRLLAESTFNLQ